MTAMICEMCGGHDLVKQEGMYVCQNCGTKYSVEEARKLLGTIPTEKVEKSSETDKLLTLARRARENGNSENAEKYYDMLLQEDPNNWEAVYFQVYYQSMQCKIMNISSAAYAVANNIDITLKLIAAIQDEDEKNSALNTVIGYSQSIANMFANAAINHYTEHSTVSGALAECSERVVAAKSIFSMLETYLKSEFPDDTEKLLTVQKALHLYLTNKRKFFNDEFFVKECNRLASEIKSKDESYETKTIEPETKSGGCYVATAVYGSYDCPQVWTLRRYRDNTLAKKWYGLLFIYLYYAISPTLVKWFGKTAWFKNMWKPKLDKMVKRLNDEGVEDTPYDDKPW